MMHDASALSAHSRNLYPMPLSSMGCPWWQVQPSSTSPCPILPHHAGARSGPGVPARAGEVAAHWPWAPLQLRTRQRPADKAARVQWRGEGCSSTMTWWGLAGWPCLVPHAAAVCI